MHPEKLQRLTHGEMVIVYCFTTLQTFCRRTLYTNLKYTFTDFTNLQLEHFYSGRRGQLGHGVRETWRSTPTCVETLKTKSITRVGAGHGFSVFASDNGIVMTCGDGTFGNSETSKTIFLIFFGVSNFGSFWFCFHSIR